MSGRAGPTRFWKDPNLIEDWKVKTHNCAELVIETAHERGLKTVLERPDEKAEFVVVHVIATRAQYKSARLEWLARMAISNSSAFKHKCPACGNKLVTKQPEEIDLL